MSLFSKFFRPTIDAIISDITQKVAHLHAAADQHRKDANDHMDDATISKIEAQKSQAEHDRARAIANKLSDLVTPAAPAKTETAAS